MNALLAALQSVTGLDAPRSRWLVDTVALILPWAFLVVVDRVVRRKR